MERERGVRIILGKGAVIGGRDKKEGVGGESERELTARWCCCCLGGGVHFGGGRG